MKYQIENTTLTRTTDRTYTHAVILVKNDGTVKTLNFCGSYDLARKAAGSHDARLLEINKRGTVEIRPVIRIK